MPTRLSARLSTMRVRSAEYPMSSRVSRPSFVFLSDSESSIPTMQTCDELSIDAITSGVKPGGVSTIT